MSEHPKFPLEHYGNPMSEYGIWAQGHAIRTVGPHTGHSVKTIALCENEQVAEALATAFAAVFGDKS